MGLGNLLQLAQVTLYLLTFIFCWFIWIPLLANLADFRGHCLLYADGVWVPNATEGGDFKLAAMHWGESSSCNFPVFVGIISLPISVFYLISLSLLLFRESESSWISSFLCTMSSVVLSIFTFSAGLVLSLGFNAWCSLLWKREYACDIADYERIQFKVETDINAHHFYTEFGMAQFGTWTSWLCWVALSVLSLIRLYQHNQQEDFLISATRERQRLLQKVQPNYRDANVTI